MSKILATANAPVRLPLARIMTWGALTLAVLSLGLYAGATQWGATLRLAGASTDPEPMLLRIGEHELHVPANAVRFPEQRTNGRQNEVDLYLEWPGLTGFTEASEDVFHDPEAKRLLFLRLTAMDIKTDATEERPVAAQTPGPSGLMRSPRAGLPGIAAQESVYRAPDERMPPYEASCLDGNDTVMAADCIRDVQLAPGLRLRYRFAHSLLPQWEGIDRAVLAYLAERRS